jgi:hypothetical protein
MPLNKLDNFIKNTEGRILYVSPSDLDSTDSISNQGNSLAQPFKTLQRALLEAARFSYQKGNSNDEVEKTTILLMPGQHTVDNRPGFSIKNVGTTATVTSPSGATSAASSTLSLTLDSIFDLNQEDNILYKFNSINGGVVVPRGTSIVGLDLRKTKIRPKYVPNPTDSAVPNSAIFRITGACYFWQFCIFDGSTEGTVYTDPADFSVNNQSVPTFSHHKLTCFEYADGVTVEDTGLTDLDMYYAKLSNAFNLASGRDIDDKYPANPLGFEKQRPEWEIVGAFAADPIKISTIEAGSGGTPNSQVTVKTEIPHELTDGTPIKISGVSPVDYNISTKAIIDPQNPDPTVFTYLLPNFRPNLPTPGNPSSGFVTIETDTVSGASPYIFNISLRSVYGMNGMLADGSKASGFRSMVVAQFTGVSLQKDDRAFVRYNPTNRNYSDNIAISRVAGATLSSQSSSLGTVYHLEPLSIYRSGWESSHIKATNDAFIQIVSVFAIGFNKHFDAESGGDLSITNSNSNFGQISLASAGFKKEAFNKDNNAFITSIIAPRAIVGEEENVDWISLDVGITTNTTINPGQNRLYLFGFTAEDDVPPVLTQGYRVGAKVNDKLYFTANGTEYSANILMSDGVTSSVKEHTVTSGPSSNIFTIGTHNIQTGEKVIILSDDGDLPENIVENTVYYAIRESSTQIKLASSQSAAINGNEINVYLGTNLRILSRVSDKIAGDIGHPVQFDTANNQWYINTNAGSGIYNGLISQGGVAGLTERTEPSYIKRIADTRSLDEKIYKIRVVIPKQLENAKNPENGFVIQESSSTGYRDNADSSLSSLTTSDYDYNRNPRFISTCSFDSPSKIVTVRSELPHNLNNGDSIIIKNVTDSVENPTGEDNLGYNGTFTVASIVDDMTFTYAVEIGTLGSFTNNTTSRTTSLPRFERNDLCCNLYIYRNEVITPYIEGVQDGVYHLYILSADKAVPTEFTNIKYSQNVVDLYPQLDRDNVNDIPTSAKSFAKRSPIGDVVTNDLKKSITKESTDTLLTGLNVALDISFVNNSTGIVSFTREHGLAGIVTYTGALNNGTGSSGYIPGTYQNVKLLNDSQTGTWKGATARVVVSGGGNVTSADIVSSGSGYSAGELYFDSSVIGNGNGNARFNVATSGITTAIGNVVQFTGAGTTSDTYHRITAVSADNQISIARTTGDPNITTSQYAFIVGPSVQIQTTTYSSSVGIRTFNCYAPHGLVAGNRFRVIDSSNNNLGDYIVKDRVSTTSFTSLTPSINSSDNGYILKHGLSANDASSDSSAENLGVRSVPLFDKETLVASAGISTTDTLIAVSSPVGADAITKRFPLGSYIQIDEEIMRVASSTLSSSSITVIRGSLATRQTAHDSGSLIRKINPIPIEFRRPSIVRASGHTFEYLGYGPGNYSTGLPQIQVTTLTEREEFLVQSQERSGGIVVYTGMNNNGDLFVGNRKTSSATGEEITYDNPIPTVTGEDPSRLSAVFDEVTIKERLVVEGGNSGTILSQFDGPVTFNKEVKLTSAVNAKSQLKVSDTTESTTTTNGALVVSGGVGIAKNLNIGSNLNVTGTTTLTSLLNANGGASITGSLGVFGTATLSNLSITGIATVSGAEGITSPKFKAAVPQIVTLNGTPTYKMFRSDGSQDFITSREVTTALGYIPADSASITGDFPLGNSVICDDIFTLFNGATTDFTLSIAGTPFVPAGSSANLIVSIGGVIQRPGLDFLIVQSGGGNTSTIRFTTPPESGVSCFIVALGGQGSLVSNIDWNNKGEILVATGDNAASRLQVGSTNGHVLTVDSAQATGVKWAAATPVGSVFYMAASSTATTPETGGQITITPNTYRAPSGYLICNGTTIPTSGTFQQVDASLLQNLRTFLGTTYGDDGTLPNLINNFVGYGLPTQNGGSATATLPSHSHTATSVVSDPGHAHSYTSSRLGGARNDAPLDDYIYQEAATTGASLTGITVATSISAEGSSPTNANLPPYVGMLPVIKY